MRRDGRWILVEATSRDPTPDAVFAEALEILENALLNA
jgi:hypothetical protein